MKIKILLCGNNQALIKEFFLQADNQFECMSTSYEWYDIACHIKYFAPDAFVCFVGPDAEEEFKKIRLVKRDSKYRDIPIILVGTEEDCEQIGYKAVGVIDCIIQRPISSSAIKERVIEFVSNKRKEKAYKEETTDSEKEEQMIQEDSVPDDSTTVAKETEKDDGRKKSVLIVDDDRGVLRLLKACLMTQYDVTTLANGNMVTKYFKNKTADAILLDYEMPDMNGTEVFNKLKENPDTKDIPVIFLTGVAEREKIQEVLALNPQGYLLKPINMGRLRETIKEILGE